MKASDLTPEDLSSLSIVERACSAFSLVGCAFIISTFLGSKAFRMRPINRLVFYASIGNVLVNIATLIARSSLYGNPDGGLCQVQGFLIQWLMPADVYWTLAMAFNVYLTFYWKFSATGLRRLERYYLVFCYGAPFLPAFVYLLLSTQSKGKVYGNATIWCWVANSWDILRIATFYAPVWAAISITIFIYGRAGREIYNKRKALRNFGRAPPEPLIVLQDPFRSEVTTEVHVRSEPIALGSDDIDLGRLNYRRYWDAKPLIDKSDAYSCSVVGNVSMPSPVRLAPFSESPQVGFISSIAGSTPLIRSKAGSNATTDSVTPILQTKSTPNFGSSDINPIRRHAAHAADNAAWAYTKVAVLFFIAMMVTWIPSSANRVYSVVHTGEISIGLEYASAFVLPLQGLWNASIYASTNLSACKTLWKSLISRFQLKKRRDSDQNNILGIYTRENTLDDRPDSKVSHLYGSP